MMNRNRGKEEEDKKLNSGNSSNSNNNNNNNNNDDADYDYFFNVEITKEDEERFDEIFQDINAQFYKNGMQGIFPEYTTDEERIAFEKRHALLREEATRESLEHKSSLNNHNKTSTGMESEELKEDDSSGSEVPTTLGEATGLSKLIKLSNATGLQLGLLMGGHFGAKELSLEQMKDINRRILEKFLDHDIVRSRKIYEDIDNFNERLANSSKTADLLIEKLKQDQENLEEVKREVRSTYVALIKKLLGYPTISIGVLVLGFYGIKLFRDKESAQIMSEVVGEVSAESGTSREVIEKLLKYFLKLFYKANNPFE